MPEQTQPRPTQVTLAAALVMLGSVFVVLASFDQVAGLHTLETREGVEEFLDGAGRGLGLDVQGMLSLMRVLTMVAAACATAAGILGFHVLRRSRSARLALTILAAPLFLTGLVVGGFFPAVVVGAIVMLWFQPARDWVDGKAPRPAPEKPAPRQGAAPPSPPLPTAPTVPGPGGQEPREVSGFGDRASLLASLPPPGHAPPGRARMGAPPPALRWACVLTWVGAGFVTLMMLASVVLVLATPDLLRDELYRQNPAFEDEGITLDEIRGTVLVAGGLLIAWSLFAIGAAVFAWQGRRWAWSWLTGSTISAALLCLVGILSSPVMILPLALCAATAVLLFRPEVRAHFR